MNKFEALKKLLNGEKKTLEEALAHAKKACDEAPTAMESHSDTLRNQTEKLVIALQEKLKELDHFISQIPNEDNVTYGSIIKLWSQIELTIGETHMNLLLVPDGLGGKNMEGVKLLSISSELGKILLGRKLTDNFLFNGKPVEIRSIG